MIVRAARYLRVAPWDLVEQSSAWENIATAMMTEEAKAEKSRSKRASRKHGRKH